MKLPNLAQPVNRTMTNAPVHSGIEASSIVCTACCLAKKACGGPVGFVCSLLGCSC